MAFSAPTRLSRPCRRSARQYSWSSSGFRGEWTITPAEDVAFVRRCADQIGHLEWAAYAGTGSVHSRLIIHDDRKVAGRVH